LPAPDHAARLVGAALQRAEAHLDEAVHDWRADDRPAEIRAAAVHDLLVRDLPARGAAPGRSRLPSVLHLGLHPSEREHAQHHRDHGRLHPASTQPRSTYTAARCVAGRNAYTRLRSGSKASVCAPFSVTTVSARRSVRVSNTSMTPGSPMATYSRASRAFRKMTSGSPASAAVRRMAPVSAS